VGLHLPYLAGNPCLPEPILSHLSETDAGSLNSGCYMWWEAFACLALPVDPNLRTAQGAALRTMARTLGIQSPACQESAYTDSDIGTGTMLVRCAQLSMSSSPPTRTSTRASSVMPRRPAVAVLSR
jgi:hypothetical protein